MTTLPLAPPDEAPEATTTLPEADAEEPLPKSTEPLLPDAPLAADLTSTEPLAP
jgi:hypothetical protein